MNEIVIYKTDDGKNKIDVKLENETLWLTQEQMATVFNKTKPTINEHIKNIFAEGELNQELVMRKFENSEFSTKPTNFYNLDVIIAVGYRVKSPQGTQFRIWATEILKEYITKGFAMDDERLKQSGGDYWKELFDDICVNSNRLGGTVPNRNNKTLFIDTFKEYKTNNLQTKIERSYNATG